MPSPTETDTRPPAGRTVAAGIVFAMAIEADAFERLATRTIAVEADGLTFHEGIVAGRPVAWCVSGAGSKAAARAATLLVAGHRPATIVSAGFAGGLDPSLARGTAVRAAQVVDAAGHDPIELSVPENSDPAGATRRQGGGPPAVVAVDRIVSVERIVRTAAEKRGLLLATGGRLVDLETHAAAGVARGAGLPCVSIRVISDDATQELPAEVATLARPQSAVRRLGAALGAVGRRPGAALDLWKLYENAVVDGRTLATAVARTLAAG
jgi:adenosylhomocysteine nucleosidase